MYKIQSHKEKFTIMPNIIDDMKLSLKAFRLYLRIRRRAGDSGKCWESTESLAAACRMSKTSVILAKRELENAELIIINKITSPHGGLPYHEISITDIWTKNFEYYK